jgi:hypothetical protein
MKNIGIKISESVLTEKEKQNLLDFQNFVFTTILQIKSLRLIDFRFLFFIYFFVDHLIFFIFLYKFFYDYYLSTFIFNSIPLFSLIAKKFVDTLKILGEFYLDYITHILPRTSYFFYFYF